MTTRTKAGMLAFLACILFAILTLKLFSPPKALPATADLTDFSAERAMEHLKIVAEAPHSLGTPQNDKVISYLVQTLTQLGVEVSIQDTLVSRTGKGSSRTRVSSVRNVIGRLKGTDNSQAVLLMAHHDSQPNTPGAADDGSGVVSILETIRAIKASGSLKNDIIILITDAEEIGLMGAKAFVDYHPLLKDVGMLINVEARGNFGVSMSFEMNPENGWVVREFAKAAPYPFANSMAYEIYKVMPNDTDFSMFRETPISGVNSATVEGLVHYHSMTDTPENISLDLVQHHGANMLGMARHFGNIAIKDTKAPDAIFFNPIGASLIIYSATYDLPLMLLTLFLFILTIIIGIKKDQVILQELFNGTGYFLIILALAGIGSYILQQAILVMNPHYTLFYGNSFYNISYYFLAFLGFTGLFYTIIYSFQPKVNSLSLCLGGLLMLVMAMFGLTLSLPTGTYFLYYPIGIFLAIQLLLLSLNITADNKPIIFAAGQFLALIPAIGLWSQIIYLLFHTFALTEAIIAPVLIFCFLGILMVPLLRMISLWNKNILTIFAGLVCLFGLIGGHFTSNYSAEKPLQTFLMYGLDADNKKATWATNKKYKNGWVSAMVNNDSLKSFDHIYPTLDWEIWQSTAPLQAIATSKIQLVSDSLNTENQHVKSLDIQFLSFVNSMELFLEKGSNISSIQLNGFDIQPIPSKKDDEIYINFFAPPTEGFNLTITTKNEIQKMRIVDRTIGLPTHLFPSPMPADMIHGSGGQSNVTLVKKSHNF